MSTLRVNTLQTASGVEVYTAKAWVNFNGTGTVAIRAAGNVSSITDNGTGDYTINFTTAMPDANYVVQGCGFFSETAVSEGMYNPVAIRRAGAGMLTASSVRIATSAQSGGTPTLTDFFGVYVAIFR